MFLPVKADFQLPHFPVLTVLVCVICFGVFLKQQSDWSKFDLAIARYCMKPQSRIEQMVMSRIHKLKQVSMCGEFMYYLSMADDPAGEIDDVVASLKPLTGFNAADSREYLTQMLQGELAQFRSIVPDDPDSRVGYHTSSWNPIRMLTSSFAHGDWAHIIFNLIFFIAFATTVEALIGSVGFVVFILINALLIGLTDSIVSTLAANHHWTLGLSGVVMGVMGAHAFLLPRGRIRCYYWIIVLFGSIALPAWMLAAWYIGGDFIRLLTSEDYGGINLLAHVAGGVAGYGYALLFLKSARLQAVTLQRDMDKAAFRPAF